MSVRLLLSLAAVYMTLVGLGYIFAPKTFGVGAVPPDASSALLAYLRLFGSPLLGIAAMNWKVRNAGPSPARDAILLGNTVGFGVIAALDVWGWFNGARELAKLFGIVHLLFAFAFLWVERANTSTGQRTGDDNR